MLYWLTKYKRNAIILLAVMLAVIAVATYALTRPKDEFKSTNIANIPTLLYFSADWCVPCKEFRPVMIRIRDKYEGQINVKYINIDKDKDNLAYIHGVEQVPTLVFLDAEGKSHFFNWQGKNIKKISGATTLAGVERYFKAAGWID